ncbi:asparagine synthetase [glutamine-hydrolyzing] [Halyomorpha halys]|uniref:asparagine synthetase [glutamine-hydrolyzing] n=1 Tax=Halyomorpha halys TaxID=286706 RepID=UPI0006D4C9F2|nr:asparagine synthetase [glutamine-hydrolyzing] [Halyomorpha halys]
MCGIWALFGHYTDSITYCDDSFCRIRHRGPDAWRLQFDDKIKEACIGFVRLKIVDSVWGMQPMILHEFPHLTLVCNGELYNCKRLGEEFSIKYETRCDVECITQLFARGGIKHAVSNLDGVFGFVLVDSKNRKVYAARDPYGVRPLFRFESQGSGLLGFCSEGKGLISLKNLVKDKLKNGFCDKWSLKQFPPGHFVEYDILPNGKVKLVKEERFYTIGNRPIFRPFVAHSELTSDVHANIRLLLTEAVRKRLMSDRRIGCLLSGGLDSSLIAALLLKLAKEEGLDYKIQTFAVGMGTSPDIVAARQVAKHIGSDHHEVIFTEQTVKDVLDTVIYHLETCDITTIRASIGMYILSEYIKQKTDSTVIFSGEGSDELSQGYIYFRKAPTPEAGTEESLRLLNDIYLYDGLRADRATAAHSLELRVPFLDLQFSSYYLSLPGEMRQPIDGVEKHLLRSAFSGTDLLPNNILWRHKEAFSDGVASVKKSLFEVIQDIIDPFVSQEQLDNASKLFPYLTPTTKESYYYRMVFEKHFPGQASSLIPYFWMPKWSDVKDPSARFLDHYKPEE